MFKELEKINNRPRPFEFYTASELWTNEYTAKQMLQYHLNESIDVSSRRAEFIDLSVDWIVSRFGVESTTTVADFGCGPGLYAKRLAEAGAQVTGIDFSENSLKYAKEVADQEGLNIDYINENYLNFETSKRFDLIIMIMCDFCALSPKQRKTLLAKFASFLKPGGFVLLDVYSLNMFDQKEESATYELNQLNGFWSPEDYYCFVNTFKYLEEKVILDKYTIVEASRTRIVYNWLQYFSPETLEKEFVESGFTLDKLYSDVAGTPFSPESTEFAVVATLL
jgi:cyclopropane fatty-acyl-phospholipid synthase-like methyltransferase